MDANRSIAARRVEPQSGIWRFRRAVACLIACLSAGGAAQSAIGATQSDCRPAPSRDDVLDGVDARGELRLGSGARVVLDGVRWPREREAAGSASDAILRHRGRTLSLVARGDVDRWGRAHVDAAVADEPLDLAGSLIEAGLAQVDAGERDGLCRPALLRVEAGARSGKRGVWRAPLLEARDGAGLSAQLGRFVVAEGRIVGVGERRSRTYLDFVRRGEDGLTVTVSKRTWRQLQERGLSAATLKGRSVRVRGVVESWRGPTMDIASADMIEVLDGEQALRR